MLTLWRLLRLVGVDIKMPPFIERDGWVDQMKLSWSSKERHLPNGEVLPVGVGFQGTYATLFGLIEVNMRAVIPFTPTMVKLLLIVTGVGAAKVIPQFIAELLTGYTILFDASTPPYSFVRDQIQLYESPTNLANGPRYFVQVIVKPLSLEFGYKAVTSAYVRLLGGLYEIYALWSQEIFGFRCEATGNFFGIKYGFLVEGRVEVSGALIKNPQAILDKSHVLANVYLDTDSFNSMILNPLNSLVSSAIAAVRNVVLYIPQLGSAIAALLDILASILEVRIYRVFAAGIISWNVIGLDFEFAGRFFGFDLNLKLNLPTISVNGIVDAIWKRALEPMYSALQKTRGGPSLLHCASGEEQFGPLCANRCASNYQSLFPVCLERCPSGYTDVGLVCTKFEFTGPKWCKAWKVRWPCGCPSGFRNLGFGCVKLHVHVKNLYFRLPKPIRKCERAGRTSLELWLGVPFSCWERCAAGQLGVFGWCVDRRMLPF
jgi:hypothetical protein